MNAIPISPFPPTAERFPIYYESADAQHCKETRALLHLAAMVSASGAILEIGTHTGIKAMEFALNFPGRQIITVDWSHASTTMNPAQAEQLPPAEIGIRCRHLPNVVTINADSKNLDYEILAKHFGPIGFIFIDGDHSDEGVWADSRNAIEYARQHGAIIAWHDYCDCSPGWVGVKRVLSDLASQGLCLTEIEGTRTAYTAQFAKDAMPDTTIEVLPRYVDVSLLPPHQQKVNLPAHWQNERVEAAIWTKGLPPQLTINGEPLAHAYVPPDCSDFAFRPCAGGNSIWEHLPRLAHLASQCAVIVEIGIATMNGSTHAFDLGLQASEKADGRKFHIGVDIHPSISGPWVPVSPWWEFVSGSSQDEATVEKVRRLLTYSLDGGGQGQYGVDILYIDTVHEYDFLKKELETWLPLIGPHTLVLFHDTHRGGTFHEMTNAILEMVDGGAPSEQGDGILIHDGMVGPLFATHQYDQISTSCEGLGALIPRDGWPK